MILDPFTVVSSSQNVFAFNVYGVFASPLACYHIQFFLFRHGFAGIECLHCTYSHVASYQHPMCSTNSACMFCKHNYEEVMIRKDYTLRQSALSHISIGCSIFDVYL
jgi:hypothetical protein